MESSDIANLQGKELRHAFICTAFKNVLINKNSLPIALQKDQSQLLIFTEEGQKVDIQFFKIEHKDVIYVLEILKSVAASFNIDENSLMVTCTIQGVSASGIDYLEAGMRAYVQAFMNQRPVQ